MRTFLVRHVLLTLLVASPILAYGKAPVILVLGDSLSAAHGLPLDAGWVHLLVARLSHQGYPDQVINASISGDTTAGGLSRLPAEIKHYHPAIIIVELGGNDGLQGTPVATFRSQLEALIITAQRSGARALLVGVRLPPNYGPAYTHQFHQVFNEVARSTGVPLVPCLLKGVATHTALMQSDGIHPTRAAQPRLLDNVWPTLRSLLNR